MLASHKVRRAALWLPAMLILLCSALIASGVSILPLASAVDNDTVTVVGNVGATIDVTPTCGANADGTNDFAALVTSGSFVKTSGDCSIDVTSNNMNGVKLTVTDGRVPATSTAFCKPVDCATGNSRVEDASVGGSLDNDEFGLALASVTGTGATNDYTLNAGSAQAGAWYPVAASADACRNASAVLLTCAFRFAVDTKDAGAGGQNSGSYNALVLFTGVAL